MWSLTHLTVTILAKWRNIQRLENYRVIKREYLHKVNKIRPLVQWITEQQPMSIVSLILVSKKSEKDLPLQIK